MDKELKEYHFNPIKIKKENEELFLNQDIKVSFDGFLISEIFLRKDFQSLLESLVKVYSSNPHIKNNFESRNIEKFLKDNNYRGKVFLPQISSKGFFGDFGIPLPKEICSIQVYMEKVCPDFVSLSLIFLASKETNQEFNNIISSYHYPELIENFNIEGKGYSYQIIDIQQRKKLHVQEFVTSIKKEGLLFISSIIPLGELWKIENTDYFSNFPALNIFLFTGDRQKILSNRHFLDMIDFSNNGFQTFQYEDSHYLYWDNNIFTLLINGNKFENNPGLSPYGILEDFEFSIVSIYSWFKYLDLEIDKINNDILSNSKDFSEMSLKKEKLISKFIIFDRLSGINLNNKFNTGIFNSIEPIPNRENNFEKIYIDMTMYFIEQKSIIINKIIFSINNLFELKNTTENANLQKVIGRLTWMMFGLAIIQVLFLQYDDKKYIYKLIWDMILLFFH